MASKAPCANAARRRALHTAGRRFHMEIKSRIRHRLFSFFLFFGVNFLDNYHPLPFLDKVRFLREIEHGHFETIEKQEMTDLKLGLILLQRLTY